MRWESLVIGVVILGFGVFLVSSHGYLGHTYLPGLIGISPPGSSNASAFSTFGGYGPGTLIAIVGLGMIGAGLRAPASRPAAATPQVTPEMMAAMVAAHQQMLSAARPVAAPSRACPACGTANTPEAAFCNKCGGALSAPAPPPPAPAPKT